MKQENMLEVKELSFSYEKQGRKIFSEISFSMKPGEIFVILGANGAGKSTLLNCVSGLNVPDSGEVLLDGRNINAVSIRERATIMGYVPQISVPSFHYTVRDYIVMGRAPHIGLLGVPGDEEYAKTEAVMERMEITKLADKLVTQISGGERQQVQIARVLVQESKLVILDEPTNHLDYGNQLKILDVIKDLAGQGLSVILTTHMPDHAILLGGRIGILDERGHMTVGDTEDVLSEDALKQLYHTDLHLVYIKEIGRTACVAGSIR